MTHKKKQFECAICNDSFLATSNSHPKRCPGCRHQYSLESVRKHYAKNRDAYLASAKKSQDKFIQENGIARAPLIRHGLSVGKYKEMRIEGCVVCGFNDVVDIHRVIHGKNSKLVLLCPNHHHMHHRLGVDYSKHYS